MQCLFLLIKLIYLQIWTRAWWPQFQWVQSPPAGWGRSQQKGMRIWTTAISHTAANQASLQGAVRHTSFFHKSIRRKCYILFELNLFFNKWHHNSKLGWLLHNSRKLQFCWTNSYKWLKYMCVFPAFFMSTANTFSSFYNKIIVFEHSYTNKIILWQSCVW